MEDILEFARHHVRELVNMFEHEFDREPEWEELQAILVSAYVTS